MSPCHILYEYLRATLLNILEDFLYNMWPSSKHIDMQHNGREMMQQNVLANLRMYLKLQAFLKNVHESLKNPLNIR